MYGTRVFLNPEFDVVDDMRRSFILRDGGSSQTILSSERVYPFHTEFVMNTERKHVDEISDAVKETSYVIVATIRMIEEEFGWFYVACRQHNRKVQFRLQDQAGSVSFLMFDKDVAKLIGLSANAIRERQLKSGDVDVFPHELNMIINKHLAFKITVANYNLEKDYHVYTVAKVCDDQEIIVELQANDDTDQGSDGQSCLEKAKIEDSSQNGLDCKDGASCTGSSLAIDLEKDLATSPGEKRPASSDIVQETLGEIDPTSNSPKRVRKKLEV